MPYASLFQLTNISQITTLVPTENGANSLVSPFRPTLHNILRLSGARKLSTFEALVLTSALYSRCLRHADFSLPESRVDYPSYDFWMHHYHISESVNQLTCSTNVDSTLPSSITEPSILYMNFRIQAIMICLHYAAVSRESKTNSTGSQSSESETKCLKAALNITNMTRQIREQANPINVSSCLRALFLVTKSLPNHKLIATVEPLHTLVSIRRRTSLRSSVPCK